MSTLDEWLSDAERALGLDPATVPADLRNQLLDLTREVAHGVARIAGPLTCYQLGLAVGRGAPPAAALAAITDLARARATDTGAIDTATTADAAPDAAADPSANDDAGPPAGADITVPAAREADAREADAREADARESDAG